MKHLDGTPTGTVNNVNPRTKINKLEQEKNSILMKISETNNEIRVSKRGITAYKMKIKRLEKKLPILLKQANQYEHKLSRINREIKEERLSYGFDDELFDEFNSVDILMTDVNHVPKGNHFHQEVTVHLKDVDYNPAKEKKKYDYDKVLAVRDTLPK